MSDKKSKIQYVLVGEVNLSILAIAANVSCESDIAFVSLVALSSYIYLQVHVTHNISNHYAKIAPK